MDGLKFPTDDQKVTTEKSAALPSTLRWIEPGATDTDGIEGADDEPEDLEADAGL